MKMNDVVYIPERDTIGIVEHMVAIYDEESLKQAPKFIVMVEDYKSKKNKRRLDKSYTESIIAKKSDLIPIGVL